MSTSLAAKLTELETLTKEALRSEWRRLFRAQPPSISRDLLMRAIGHRYQELEHGGLSKAAARKLRTVAGAVAEAASKEDVASASDDASANRRSPSPRPALLPGARLIRVWHGATHSVTVTDAGFDYAGRSYRSLTEIAREITGTHWSGPRFFGLGAAGGNGGIRSRSARSKAAAAAPTSSASTKRKAIHHG
jgi:hypothetical protein